MKPARGAISFKRAERTYGGGGGAALARDGRAGLGLEVGGKNRKPLYKLIPRGRGVDNRGRGDRINTIPPSPPPPHPAFTASDGFRSLSPALPRPRCGLIASAEKLFSSTLMNNANGFAAARQKLLRRMKSSWRAAHAAGGNGNDDDDGDDDDRPTHSLAEHVRSD